MINISGITGTFFLAVNFYFHIGMTCKVIADLHSAYLIKTFFCNGIQIASFLIKEVHETIFAKNTKLEQMNYVDEIQGPSRKEKTPCKSR